jgi:hypothetical protein
MRKANPKLKFTRRVNKGGLGYTEVSLQESTTSIVRSKHYNKQRPTDEHITLRVAFDFLNTELLDGMLEDVHIMQQRKSHSGGHFAPDRWSYRVGDNIHPVHEISLNPDGFHDRSDEWIISILLHEMVHEWQHLFSAKRRKKYSYHDREWADKMESLGLMPSNSGMVGGKRTGVQMSHFIIDNGPYQKAFAKLASTGWQLNLESNVYPGAVKRPDDSHTKFVCPACGWIIRGKPDTEVTHNPCGCTMLAERPVDQLSEAAE